MLRILISITLSLLMLSLVGCKSAAPVKETRYETQVLDAEGNVLAVYQQVKTAEVVETIRQSGRGFKSIYRYGLADQQGEMLIEPQKDINIYLVARHLAAVVDNSAAFDKDPNNKPYTIVNLKTRKPLSGAWKRIYWGREWRGVSTNYSDDGRFDLTLLDDEGKAFVTLPSLGGTTADGKLISGVTSLDSAIVAHMITPDGEEVSRVYSSKGELLSPVIAPLQVAKPNAKYGRSEYTHVIGKATIAGLGEVELHHPVGQGGAPLPLPEGAIGLVKLLPHRALDDGSEYHDGWIIVLADEKDFILVPGLGDAKTVLSQASYLPRYREFFLLYRKVAESADTQAMHQERRQQRARKRELLKLQHEGDQKKLQAFYDQQEQSPDIDVSMQSIYGARDLSGSWLMLSGKDLSVFQADFPGAETYHEHRKDLMADLGKLEKWQDDQREAERQRLLAEEKKRQEEKRQRAVNEKKTFDQLIAKGNKKAAWGMTRLGGKYADPNGNFLACMHFYGPRNIADIERYRSLRGDYGPYQKQYKEIREKQNQERLAYLQAEQARQAREAADRARAWEKSGQWLQYSHSGPSLYEQSMSNLKNTYKQNLERWSKGANVWLPKNPYQY